MINTKLPYDKELECSVLGAVVQDNDAYNEVAKYFNNDDVFSDKTNQILWNKIALLRRDKRKYDLVSICSSLTLEEKWLKQLLYNRMYHK